MQQPTSHTPKRLAKVRVAAACAGMIGVGWFGSTPLATAETPSHTTESTSDTDSRSAELATLLVTIVSDVARDDTTQDLMASVGQVTACLLTRTAAGGPGPTPELVVAACAAPLATIDPAVGLRLVSAAELDRLVPLLARAQDTENTEGAPGFGDRRPQPDTSRQQQAARPTPYPMPASGTVTAPFGDGRNHQGIDVAAPMNSPIRAVADGEVIDAGPAQGFGLWVRIRHDDGTVTTYGHNNSNTVTVGERVTAGQQIAKIGSRGDSTGPHVHFEVDSPAGVKLDPQTWLSQRRIRTGGA